MKQITNISGTWDLSNGVEMPYFGLGVFQTQNGKEIVNAIHHAFDAGYRHIDTASFYDNETGVGEAIRKSSINRNDIFVTSKVWNDEQGYSNTLKAFDASLKRLGFDYLDLYLVHWPVTGKFKETWKALEYLYKQGKVRAIGVSNFLVHHLEDLLPDTEIKPMVNQVEFHPYVAQPELLNYCNKNNIQFEAWSPLMQGYVVNVDLLYNIAETHGKTAAQVVLRWDLQKGVITIPKSVKKERIIENGSIFDFELSDEEIRQIDLLDKNQRFGVHPDELDF